MKQERKGKEKKEGKRRKKEKELRREMMRVLIYSHFRIRRSSFVIRHSGRNSGRHLPSSHKKPCICVELLCC